MEYIGQGWIKRFLISIAIAAALLLAIGVGFSIAGPAEKKNPKSAGADNFVVDASAEDSSLSAQDDAMAALSDRNVYFAGLDNVTVSKGTAIELSNPAENQDIYIKYSIYDNSNSEKLFETDLIPAGAHVNWEPASQLKPGAYEICYNQTPLWKDDAGNYIALTSANNITTLTVE